MVVEAAIAPLSVARSPRKSPFGTAGHPAATDCLYDLAIWDDYDTHVSGAYIEAGDVGVYTFPGVPGRAYQAFASSCDFCYIQVFSDSFTATLGTHAVHFTGDEGGGDYDSGDPLCDPGLASQWQEHGKGSN